MKKMVVWSVSEFFFEQNRMRTLYISLSGSILSEIDFPSLNRSTNLKRIFVSHASPGQT